MLSAGWQSQVHARGVQSVVEAALSIVADHPVDSRSAAGRTDAGVHAAMQVVHFDTPAVRTERGWVLGATTNLPPQVSVLWAREVPEAFHARYSALARRYRYVILNRTPRPGARRASASAGFAIRSTKNACSTAAAASGRRARLLVVPRRRMPVAHADAQHVRDRRRAPRRADRADGLRERLPASHGAQHRRRADRDRHGRAPTGLGGARCWRHAIGRQGGVTAPPGGLYLAGIRYAPASVCPASRTGTSAGHLACPVRCRTKYRCHLLHVAKDSLHR